MSASNTPVAKKRKVSASNRANGSPTAEQSNGPMEIQILNLALSWLDPKDLGLCSQVCPGWRDGIAQYTWKQSAENENPEAFQALEAAMNKSKGEKLSYQAIATGLVKYLHFDRPTEIPDPKLKPEHLFLLVEVHAFGVKGAWCKSLSETIKAFDPDEPMAVNFRDVLEEASTVEFQIPEDKIEDLQAPKIGTPPYDPGADLIFDNMRVTLSLWRTDTGQTLCLCRRKDTHRNCAIDKVDSSGRLEFSDGYYFRSDLIQPDGVVAAYISNQNNYKSFSPFLSVFLKSQLPSDHALVQAVSDDQEFPSRDDMLDLFSKESIKYQIRRLEVLLTFIVGDDEDNPSERNVKSSRHFLLFLEGLSDWT